MRAHSQHGTASDHVIEHHELLPTASRQDEPSEHRAPCGGVPSRHRVEQVPCLGEHPSAGVDAQHGVLGNDVAVGHRVEEAPRPLQIAGVGMTGDHDDVVSGDLGEEVDVGGGEVGRDGGVGDVDVAGVAEPEGERVEEDGERVVSGGGGDDDCTSTRVEVEGEQGMVGSETVEEKEAEDEQAGGAAFVVCT